MTPGDGTRAVHAGLPGPRQGAPLLPGPTFASYYHLEGDPETADYVYGRYGNPTWTLYERALGELEGGTAVSFASGMAAASSSRTGSPSCWPTRPERARTRLTCVGAPR